MDEAARRGGALSDATAGTLVKWTHNKTFEYFEKRWGWSREDFRAVSAVSGCTPYARWKTSFCAQRFRCRSCLRSIILLPPNPQTNLSFFFYFSYDRRTSS